MLEKVLKRRVTKDFAETYEVVSSKRGFREFYILFPGEELDPLKEDYFTLTDRLEAQNILFSVYPVPSDRPEVKARFLKNSPIIREVIL
jgi:hypothetical protein